MTPEERLTRLETLVPELKDDIREMKKVVDELAKLAHMGTGVLWLIIKFGVFLAGVAGVLKLVWDAFGVHHP